MLSLMRNRFFQFLEHWRQKGLLSALLFVIYKEEEAVPVVKDLKQLPPVKVPQEGFRLVDVTPETFPALALVYPLRSRRERTGKYFRRGYRALAMVGEGNKVVGDLWYVSRGSARTSKIHPHVRWFGLDLSEDDVYMFDMHVVSDQRGGGLATYFLKSALHHLHSGGYERAYGYFAAQNTPALWVHRLIGYRELPHFLVRRVFFYETARAKD
jgi:GNAT superfamily N-acetyltransferase